MRRKLIFLLLSGLIGSGSPGTSLAGDFYHKFKGDQRLALGPKLALNTWDFEHRGVLKQTANPGQRPVDSPEWDKNKPGGISEQAATGIVLVGVAAVIIIFMTTAYGKGGS